MGSAVFLQLIIKHTCRNPSSPALCEITSIKFIFCDMAQSWASVIDKENYMKSSSTTGKVTEFFLTSLRLTLNDSRKGEGLLDCWTVNEKLAGHGEQVSGKL